MNRAPSQYRVIWPKNHQCTHHIMARLYTSEFRCSMCTQFGAFGWLYRCVQDREFQLEDDWDHGFPEKIDPISDLFEKPTIRPRSPESRLSRLALLDEINDQQFKSYTPAQLKQILEQRARVLGVARSEWEKEWVAFTDYQVAQSSNSSHAITDLPINNVRKPWLPLPGGECQFRVCPRCRPTFRERAYLSLDAITNGDIPATAVAGFGFHLKGLRPVSSGELVAQIGQRPSPRPRSPIILEEFYGTGHGTPTTQSIAGDMGLGIFDHRTESFASFTPSSPDPSSETEFTAAEMQSIRTSDIPQGDGIAGQESIPRALPPATGPYSSPTLHMTPMLRQRATSSSLRLALDTPLPLQTDEEFEIVREDARRPLTPMEKDELEEGRFSSLPLDVGGGLAVSEESLELHSADVITQY